MANRLSHTKRTKSQRRTVTLRINYNRSTALEWSVINYRGRGLNRFYASATLALGSVVVYKHTGYSVSVRDFTWCHWKAMIYACGSFWTSLISKKTYESRFNIERREDVFSTARPTLKSWSKKKLEQNKSISWIRRAWTKTQHQAPTFSKFSLSLRPDTLACN